LVAEHYGIRSQNTTVLSLRPEKFSTAPPGAVLAVTKHRVLSVPAPPVWRAGAAFARACEAGDRAVMLPAVAAVATALLLPCRPTAFDLAAVPATVALARAAHKPTAFVRTACPARAPDVAEATAALATHGVPVAPIRLGARRAYARMIHTIALHTLSPERGIDPCAST